MPSATASERDGGAPRPAWRRRLRRIIWTLAIVAALVWSLEPFFRREILLDTSLPLVTGSEATGVFTPDLAPERTRFEVHFHEAGSYPLSEANPAREAVAKRLAEALRGGWRAVEGTPGLQVTVEVLQRDQSVHTATTGQRLLGTFGPDYVSVHLTHLRASAEAEHVVVARVTHADPALAAYEARLVVANSGDWWSYRVLEQTFRPMLAAAALLLAAFFAWLAGGLGPRRASTRP